MLKDLLQRLLHQDAAPVPAILQHPTPQSDLPTHGQLYEALKRYQNNMPMDNLDGTYSNQPTGTAIFQNKGQWHPPLLPGVKDGDGLPHFDPLNTKDRYIDSAYPLLKINPEVMNRYKPMPLMEYK
jgi:hypothetical protein